MSNDWRSPARFSAGDGETQRKEHGTSEASRQDGGTNIGTLPRAKSMSREDAIAAFANHFAKFLGPRRMRDKLTAQSNATAGRPGLARGCFRA